MHTPGLKLIVLQIVAYSRFQNEVNILSVADNHENISSDPLCIFSNMSKIVMLTKNDSFVFCPTKNAGKQRFEPLLQMQEKSIGQLA